MSERRDRFDPELAELFGDDPELLELAQRVRESRPEPDLDPRFPAILRARLMEEARTALRPRPRPGSGSGRPAAARSPPGGRSRWERPWPRRPPWPSSTASHRHPGGWPWSPQREPPAGRSTPARPSPSASTSRSTPRASRPCWAALKIEPATQVTVTWENPETLVVTPIHPLAADTDYQVTIPKSAVQSQSGQTLSSDVTIDFGTQPAPTPTATSSPVPALVPAVVGPAASDGLAFWGPGGAPGVTDSTAGQPTPAAAPAASPSATPSASLAPRRWGPAHRQPTPRRRPPRPPHRPRGRSTSPRSAPVTLSDTPVHGGGGVAQRLLRRPGDHPAGRQRRDRGRERRREPGQPAVADGVERRSEW